MIELRLRVLPSSSRQAVEILPDGTVKASLKSPPEKGKANRELVKVLARLLHVKRGEIKIKSGLKSREKSILIRGVDGSFFRKAVENFCE